MAKMTKAALIQKIMWIENHMNWPVDTIKANVGLGVKAIEGIRQGLSMGKSYNSIAFFYFVRKGKRSKGRKNYNYKNKPDMIYYGPGY